MMKGQAMDESVGPIRRMRAQFRAIADARKSAGVEPGEPLIGLRLGVPAWERIEATVVMAPDQAALADGVGILIADSAREGRSVTLVPTDSASCVRIFQIAEAFD